jgi:hypothetical protein
MLAYGIIVFLWMTPEDNNVLSVTVLGVVGTIIAAAHFAFRFSGRQVPHLAIIPFGGMIGGGAAVVTAFLMFLKSAAHAHIFPDYPPLLILGMLERVPAWTLAGALVGLAAALIIPNRPPPG